MRVVSATPFFPGTVGQCMVQDATFCCHGGCDTRLQYHSHNLCVRLGLSLTENLGEACIAPQFSQHVHANELHECELVN
jgi:hypothetical protein